MAKLVTIGDSLTQGFSSLAITYCDLSYPAIIADCMNLDSDSFRIPDFRGKGGMPFNVEYLARKLEKEYHSNIKNFEWFGAIYDLFDLMDEVEDYWERGKGSKPSSDILYHNLAIWGYEVGDAYNISAKKAYNKFRKKDTGDNWFALPSEPRMRTAYKTLNPAHNDNRVEDTQVSIAKKIKKNDGELENLIIFLGANNCLGTVTRLKINWTDKTPPGPFNSCTLWTPEAFIKEFDTLAEQIHSIGAKHVYFCTIPHITIPPFTRGIMKNKGRLPLDEKYYDYYAHFYVKDKQFDPDKNRCLKKEQAITIDNHIDIYNEHIRNVASKNSWHIIDFCQTLDNLAVRRNHGTMKYDLPVELKDLSTRFFEINPNGTIKNGGIFSLDGIHPTTCGYAIMAHEATKVIKKVNSDLEINNVDFKKYRALDMLVSRPPRTLDDIFGMLSFLETKFLLFSRFL